MFETEKAKSLGHSSFSSINDDQGLQEKIPGHGLPNDFYGVAHGIHHLTPDNKWGAISRDTCLCT